MNILYTAIEENNTQLFVRLNFTAEDLMQLRFNKQMNILQTACYESSLDIIRYIWDMVKDN
jgi:hypothetical protein